MCSQPCSCTAVSCARSRSQAREEGFAHIFGAALLLVALGTVTYTLSQGWSLIDGFYFAIMTLTTSSIADPHLTIESHAIKIFTVFYILIGIGILVELARQVGFAFVEVHRQDQAAKQAKTDAKRHTDPA
jgi:uncharacterized membrane protein YkgB